MWYQNTLRIQVFNDDDSVLALINALSLPSVPMSFLEQVYISLLVYLEIFAYMSYRDREHTLQTS